MMSSTARNSKMCSSGVSSSSRYVDVSISRLMLAAAAAAVVMLAAAAVVMLAAAAVIMLAAAARTLHLAASRAARVLLQPHLQKYRPPQSPHQNDMMYAVAKRSISTPHLNLS